MAEIQVEIEGEGAPAAAEALLEIPGISGTCEVPTQREGTLAAIATIITIVGGAAALAEQIDTDQKLAHLPWEVLHDGKQANGSYFSMMSLLFLSISASLFY
ncbi:hypothetical protein ACWATR_13920 [Nostoc sp. UIC 10890]